MSVDLATTDTGTVELDVIVDAEILIDALRAIGATVVWHGPKKPSETPVEMKATADLQDAYEALPAHWLQPDDEWTQPAPHDLGDFVGACLAGDRVVAAALLPRLNLEGRNAFVGEQLLLLGGGRA